MAGSNRWVNIDAAGVHERFRGGWNIHSPEAGLLLLKAAEAGDIDTVDAFIKEGANANARVDYDALNYRSPPHRLTDPWKSVTPLQRARGVDVVKALIAAGADVNTETRFGRPLQFQAETLGDADSVEALVKAGANLEARSLTGQTPLMRATIQPHPAVVEVLLRGGAEVNA